MTAISRLRRRVLRLSAAAAATTLLFAGDGAGLGRAPAHGAQNASGGPAALGVGYWILKSQGDKTAVIVNPQGGPAAGDQIALRVRPTAAGHLYVFFHGDKADPAMIYPSLERSSAALEAGAAVEIPSTVANSSRWWEVRDGPGVDRLYVVFSREPLRDVPTGEALVKHCATIQGTCYWRPPAPLWASIANQARPGVAAAGQQPAAGDEYPPLVVLAPDGASTVVAVLDVKLKASLF